MKSFASLFSGFDGVGIGAKAAGLELAWGVELDAKIAEVGNHNLGYHIKVVNLLDCDPANFEQVDVLHASPPCPNFSIAKAGGKETAIDLALAGKVAEFVTVLQPEIFTLENVFAYRNSKSWRLIENALYGAGYWLHIDHVNCADFGVPQTRKRMLVRAVRGGFVPYLPQAQPWIGWYAAIEDLLPSLPDSQFAPWQLARLPAELKTMLVGGASTSAVQAADSVGASMVNEPTLCVNSSNSQHWRAFLLTDQYDKPSGCADRAAQKIDALSPSATVTSSNHGDWRALLIDFANAGRGATVLEENQPSMTIQSWHGRRPTHYPASLTHGRVVAMTPRCLARFQSFPDSYILPESRTLAAKGIGNAVPPLLMQRVYEGLTEM